MMLTREFWTGALERAIKTFCQTIVALIGVDTVEVIALDWPQILGTAATAAALSVLTSIGSASLGGPPGSPSLVQDQPGEPIPGEWVAGVDLLPDASHVEGVLQEAERESAAADIPEPPEDYAPIDPGLLDDSQPDYGGVDDDWFTDDDVEAPDEEGDDGFLGDDDGAEEEPRP